MSDQTQQIRARGDGGERTAAYAPAHAVAGEKFHVFRDLTDAGRLLWIDTQSVDPQSLKRRPGSSPAAATGLRMRVDAMLAAPVLAAGPPDFPGMVWPLEALLVDKTTVGFVTAVVSHEQAVSFEAACHANWPYERRLDAAQSLAEALARAHEARHWLTGLDPATIFVRPSGEVSISDCTQVRPWDAKTKRQLSGPLPPAHLRAPEVKRRADDIDETQDRYALAVLIYQMLADGALPVSVGRYVHSGANATGSWYGKWPADIRDLFDRAFGERAKRKDRPSAAEWAGALSDLRRRSRICDVKPVEHGAAILSPGAACALCEMTRHAPSLREPTIRADRENGPTRFSVDELTPLEFSIRAAPTPSPAPTFEQQRPSVREPAAVRPIMDASAPELMFGERAPMFDWRVAGAIAGFTAVVSGIAAAAAYFITPPGRLLAEGGPPAYAGEEPIEQTADERLSVRPISIGDPVPSGGMLTVTTSEHADVEFTVRSDGTAADVHVTGESVVGVGYGDEARRLVSAAAWPSRWQSRSAPYPARYRVVFPPYQALVSQPPHLTVAPLVMAHPQYSPDIIAYGRNANVTLAVRVNASGVVDSARVVQNESGNDAIRQEAMRLAMSARYPTDPNGVGYETRLDVSFIIASEQAGGKGEAPLGGSVVALNDLPLERRPSASTFARHYPDRAARENIEGRVVLLCAIQGDGRFSCAPEQEDPPNWGFGEAAVRVAREFRVSRQFPNGRATAGEQVRVPIVFRLE